MASKQGRSPLPRLTVLSFVIFLAFLVLVVVLATTKRVTQQKNVSLPKVEQQYVQETPKSVSIPAQEAPHIDRSKRIDSPGEASPAQIGKLFRLTKTISVSCGDDADMQTCKFFANSLGSALQKEGVSVVLFDDPEVLAQSFYVLPRLLPSLYVTLRLIEHGPPQAVSLNLGGSCFDPERHDYYASLELPRWIQTEAGEDYGPLETDKAEAARNLALTFAAYWADTASTAEQ